jgi:hypothetical protein
MMRRIVAPIALAAMALASFSAAQALPGQRLPAWLAWTKANPVLQNLKHTTDEMSGGIIYNKHVKAGGMAFYFAAEPGFGDNGGPATIFGENLALDGPADAYELRLHRATAAKMAGIVYGSGVGADLSNAAVAGDFGIFGSTQRLQILKGKRYMYQLNGPGLTVSGLSNLAEALKNAKICATTECGD